MTVSNTSIQLLYFSDFCDFYLQTSIEEERKSFEDSSRRSQSEIESLRDENEQIKKKLIQLIRFETRRARLYLYFGYFNLGMLRIFREKDALWKKSDRLEFQQKVRDQVWRESDSILNCSKCNAAFGFLLRKVHANSPRS